MYAAFVLLCLCVALLLGACGGGNGGGTATPAGPEASAPSTSERPRTGLLFYANHGHEDETRALDNSALTGALYQIYWSEVEPVRGSYRWSALDAHIERWRGAGRHVALRIMWSSSGYWPDPAAKTPTPQWVWDAGARHVLHAPSGTEVPLFWDPIYLQHAQAFMDAVAARYDANPAVAFIDVTPGAETNPYRLNTIDRLDPSFRDIFMRTPASDGTLYSDARWWTMLQSYVASLKQRFPTLPMLITLNQGAMPGQPSRLQDVGDLAVAAGLWVGQNGLKGSSFSSASSRDMWLRWGADTRLFFEMASATGSEQGTLQEVVDACLRVQCDWLNVYATDVLKATPGVAGHNPDWQAALAQGAAEVGP